MHTLLIDLPLSLFYVLALAVCWCLTLFGLPGNWLIVVLAAAATWIAPDSLSVQTAPAVLAVLLALAVGGEIVEFAAGSAAANRAGGTRRGAVGTILGAMLGAIAGATIGLPVPIIGSAVAAVLGGSGRRLDRGHDTGISWRPRPGGKLARGARGLLGPTLGNALKSRDRRRDGCGRRDCSHRLSEEADKPAKPRNVAIPSAARSFACDLRLRSRSYAHGPASQWLASPRRAGRRFL